MTQKPVDRDWLVQKYVVEGLGVYAIAKLVDRNPKQVWHWLRGYGIPLRKRGWDTCPISEKIAMGQNLKPYQSSGWLWTEYIFKARSAQEIASEFGVTKGLIYHYMKRYDIPRRVMSDIRATKYWGASGETNGMFGVCGSDNPNWKGGLTPERQHVYSTLEWRQAARQVKKRDRNSCQRCERDKTDGVKLEIHHIVSFAVVELRTDVNNLVLLCEDCHNYVHSRENVSGEFIATYQGEFIRGD